QQPKVSAPLREDGVFGRQTFPAEFAGTRDACQVVVPARSLKTGLYAYKSDVGPRGAAFIVPRPQHVMTDSRRALGPDRERHEHRWYLAGQRKQDLTGEFDPGSERTLAARLTHASRARKGKPR